MRRYLDHITLLAKRLSIAFVVFSICRLLFYLLNLSYFTDTNVSVFWFGLRFDISAICFLYSPFIALSLLPLPFRNARWYQLILKLLFHLSNGLAIVLNCIDFGYYKFTLKRTTSDIIDLIGLGEDFSSLLPTFITYYWYITLISIALFFLSWWVYDRTGRKQLITAPYSLKRGAIEMILLVAVTTLVVYGARGGFQLRPVSILHASEYTGTRNMALVLNTPFTVMKTLGKKGLVKRDYFPEDELNKIFDPIHYPTHSNDSTNVMVIIMESFSREFIGGYNDGEGYTPFLDSLMEHSLVYERCYANGMKSIEGIPAILSGLPTLMNNPFISSAYSANRINSLASILAEQGYTTSFLHGGTNGTMGFDAFSGSAGFKEYYGRYEYNNDDDYDGNWGIFDEPFLKYVEQILNKQPEPFMACYFSLSSHHPFTVPNQYEERFQGGPLKIHRVIQYSDLALGSFFKSASKQSWFPNTLFIITADHTSMTKIPEYGTAAGKYSVPLIFYKGDGSLEGRESKVCQQCDILPTTLDMIGTNRPFIAFGRSLLKPGSEYSVSYLNNVYQVIGARFVIQHSGKERIALYDLQADPLMKENLYGAVNYSDQKKWEIEQMEHYLMAYIQTYNDRMISNRMTIE